MSKITERSPRKFSRRAVMLGAGALAAAAVAPRPTFGQAPAMKKLKKVTLVYGVKTIDSSSDGFFASVPIGLNFYADEGLDVDIQTVAGSSAAINLLASGKAQFSTHGTAGLFSGVAKDVPMQGFICQVPDYFVSVAVMKNGPIQSFDELKGKTIGVNAVGGSPDLVMRAVVKTLGWEAGKDVKFLAVGTGVPALDAIQKDRVQALALWDTVFALLEFNGGDFRYFRPDPLPKLGFTHTTNTLLSTIEKDPEMVGGLARAMGKSIIYMAAAPPRELAKLHFKVFPETKPTGLSEEEIFRLDFLRLQARKGFMRYQERVFDRSEKIGDVADEMIEAAGALLASGNVIPKVLPAERYFTHRFIPFINSIDIPAIVAQAKAFKA